jgi:hypothetical protein
MLRVDVNREKKKSKAKSKKQKDLSSHRTFVVLRPKNSKKNKSVP